MQAKALILNLLGAHGDVLDVGALIRAGGVFALEPGTVRVALSRLARSGLVEQVGRGRWAMSSAATPLAGLVGTWRTLEALVRPWEGTWVGVATGGLDSGRSVARQRRRALDLLGFRTLRPGLEIRPDNRRDSLRERLASLGVVAPVFAVGDLGSDQAAAEGLWDTEALAAGYAARRTAIARATAEIVDLPRPEAARRSWNVGTRAIRTLALDPLLPEAMVDVGARRALAEEMQGFDQLGRRIWLDLLSPRGVA
ncbi:MAG: PaaX family transcriptional regulator [Myxococcota bacterium]